MKKSSFSAKEEVDQPLASEKIVTNYLHSLHAAYFFKLLLSSAVFLTLKAPGKKCI